jgi:peptidoglycan hydrolase-like protein with peptidoglycan-binding domain
VALVTAGGAGVVVADPFDARTKDAAAESTASTATAEVASGTLSARTQEDGTLGYAGEYDVVNSASGVVTQLPGVGDVIRTGKVLYRVDGVPVILLRGDQPAYRDLAREAEGPDVRQLNAALVSLGYATEDQIDPDSDYFGYATETALEKLQEKLGLEETGELTREQAVFLPVRALRVTKVDALSGAAAAPGRAVIKGSSTARQVTVQLNASRQSTVAKGDKVTITLPNGKTTDGVVASVGKVAEQKDDKSLITVQITPLDAKATGELDQAPVQVSIVTDTVKDVLSVPVDALLALSGGGYAVEEVRAGGKHKLIPVKTGLFDDSAGKVEVTGDGLRAGQKIVVPGS